MKKTEFSACCRYAVGGSTITKQYRFFLINKRISYLSEKAVLSAIHTKILHTSLVYRTNYIQHFNDCSDFVALPNVLRSSKSYSEVTACAITEQRARICRIVFANKSFSYM